MEEKELLESFCLCNIKGIGAASIRKLIACAQTARQARELTEEKVRSLLGEKRAELFFRGMEKECRKALQDRYFNMKKRKIFFLPFWHEDYPARLKRIPDAPAALYGMGRLAEEEKKAVAVIGARACSGYGREATKYFASGLAREGVVVVSGMARGVDGIAGLSALEAGGYSVAVLGCGVDVCYPPENRRLYERLTEEGCLLSEYPPATEPEARLFPPRNRIISGLSDLVLVTEARESSGTLITVDMALEQGKDVFAVPGRITDTCSRGCNRLIGNGAGAALSVAQLMSELGNLTSPPKALSAAVPKLPFGSEGQAPERAEKYGRPLREHVLNALDCNPKSLDEIFHIMQNNGDEAAVGEVMQELMQLCIEQKADSKAGFFFKKEILQHDFSCIETRYGV